LPRRRSSAAVATRPPFGVESRQDGELARAGGLFGGGGLDALGPTVRPSGVPVPVQPAEVQAVQVDLPQVGAFEVVGRAVQFPEEGEGALAGAGEVVLRLRARRW
jgi:hypothetical protein